MFELLLVVAAATAAVLVFLSRVPRSALSLALLATLAALPTLVQVRAVTMPALLGVAALWLAARRRVRAGGAPSRSAASWAAASLSLTLLTGLGIGMVPRAGLAPPTGPFDVGVRDWVLVDSLRDEPFTPDPDDRRVLAVRAWYPVDPGAGSGLPRAGYLPSVREVYRGMARSLGVPAVVVSGATDLVGHGFLGASPSRGGPFPLVLYSGGFQQGHLAHNTEVAEELASRGYVVVGVGHPYEQAYSVTAEGTVLTLDDSAVTTSVRLLLDESAARPPPGFEEPRTAGPDSAGALIRAFMEHSPRHRASAEIWLADMRTVLARVSRGDGEAGAFLGTLADLDRLGIFGMSFGGSTAGLFCATEPRCRAGVNLDGTQWGPWFGDEFRAPFLYLSQDVDTWNDAWYGGAGMDYHRIRIRGAFHGDFTDGFQSTPLTRWAGVLGPIGGHRSREILRAYVTAFFGLHLKEEPAPLLEGPAPFPEVDHLRDPLGRAVR